MMISGTGYSLIIAGMTLLWKRIQLLQETFLMLVMIFAFTALPVLTVPGWFTGLGRVFPVTADVARKGEISSTGYRREPKAMFPAAGVRVEIKESSR
jgi:hypothetical protein